LALIYLPSFKRTPKGEKENTTHAN
jgi:hypothetical protein